MEMGLAILSRIQKFWPFSAPKFDDLRDSKQLVRKLPVPDHTKRFVFAVREPESQSVIYILAAQNLSERSAADAECLIRELKPDAVVAQVGNFTLTEIQSEESELHNAEGSIPVSSFGVLKRCFMDKISREKYENMAGNIVLREIFGVSFHGHFFAAKRAAEDVDSAFLVLGSPVVKSAKDESDADPSVETNAGNSFRGLGLQLSSLVPQKVGSFASLGKKRFSVTNDLQSQMVKSLSSRMELSALDLSSSSDPKVQSENRQPLCNYAIPPFAQSIYPLLVDLHDIFVDYSSIGKALSYAQKIFYDVSRGGNVESELLCEVYTFRIAIEGLRVALNDEARLPTNKMRIPNAAETEFSELSVEDKSHALIAQALRSQAKKFKTIVAIVDASGLAGLRRHWNTDVSTEVKDLVEELAPSCEVDEMSQDMDRTRLLTKKSVVAVGAGASVALGASSLSKAVPISTFVKMITFKFPFPLKLFLTQSPKVTGMALGKIIGPSKLVAPGMAGSGAKMNAAIKAAASAERIRVAVHSVIASAEKTSLSAMRTAFYEIMRKRHAKQVGFLPWATFGCSVATCAGLLMYGDGIEFAAESLPVAPSIARLGRGIQNLHQTSEVVQQSHSTKIQKSIESLLYKFKVNL